MNPHHEHPAEREAREACELPKAWPFWLALVLVLTSAGSAVFPWGFA